jgi:hypothetical protein
MTVSISVAFTVTALVIFYFWNSTGAFFSRRASRPYLVGTSCLLGANLVTAPWSDEIFVALTSSVIIGTAAVAIAVVSTAAGRDT